MSESEVPVAAPQMQEVRPTPPPAPPLVQQSAPSVVMTQGALPEIPVPPLGVSTPTGLSNADVSELARARAIAQRLGITNLTDDEYDIPTYMRRQQEREL
jgi:hypothetical protein